MGSDPHYGETLIYWWSDPEFPVVKNIIMTILSAVSKIVGEASVLFVPQKGNTRSKFDRVFSNRLIKLTFNLYWL
jgi:hypothetical protein